jgi:uncharacterized protein (TIGR02147 family)
VLRNYTDYREFLRQVLADKVKANPSFSLRAFSRRLRIAHSALSGVLRGTRHLSPRSALQVATLLQLPPEDVEYFCLLVEKETARTSVQREIVSNRLKAALPAGPVKGLSPDEFRVIADWYHFAILEYADTGNPDFHPSRLARRLRVPVAEVRAAIDRLVRLGLLGEHPDRRGCYRKANSYVRFETRAPSSAFVSNHKQILALASESIESQPVEERLFGSETVAFSKQELPKVRSLAEEFYNRLLKLTETSSPKTEVYNFGVHFFKLISTNAGGPARASRTAEGTS